MTGHCSKCSRIWTLETRQGVCPWCGKLATCQLQRTQALPSLKSRSKRRKRQAPPVDDNGYDSLDGEWLTYYKVAKRYEHKVHHQDKLDIRHTIILELAKARARDNKPLPILRAYRIASLTIALYWREALKSEVRVCLYNGLPIEPHCQQCKRKPNNGYCAYLALRPIQSLDSEVTDEDGYTVKLVETVADDTAIDLEAWLDDKTWLLGCPTRLVQIAHKRVNGIPLDNADKLYLGKWRKREQKRLIN